MSLKALVLYGYGINCENETKYAVEKSGGQAEIVHINRILENPKSLENYNMLVIPGGFSFGDDLGAGKVFGNRIKFRLKDQLEEFIKAQKLILGISHGFQSMAKMGILPEPDFKQRVTLTKNDSGNFIDKWVILRANKNSPCIFTRGMEYLLVPVRHGEGKFTPKDNAVLSELKAKNQVVLQYVDGNGNTSAGYPHNPDGSVENIAGICDSSGRIFGMMPHPEAFNIPENCPYWIKGIVNEPLGLRIFKNAVEHAKQSGI